MPILKERSIADLMKIHTVLTKEYSPELMEVLDDS